MEDLAICATSHWHKRWFVVCFGRGAVERSQEFVDPLMCRLLAGRLSGVPSVVGCSDFTGPSFDRSVHVPDPYFHCPGARTGQ